MIKTRTVIILTIFSFNYIKQHRDRYFNLTDINTVAISSNFNVSEFLIVYQPNIF